jgi:hypothetical protein
MMAGQSQDEGKFSAMTTLTDTTRRVELATGALTLTSHSGPDSSELCDFAARANPKRGFLIVSRVLGRHLPAAPSEMRAAMNALADRLPQDLPERVVFLGMAETATALAQGVFARYRRTHPGTGCLYLQTSRQAVADAPLLASFEEGHSHATSHLVQVADAGFAAAVREARTLVIVDDESSTGNTFLAAAAAMAEVMPDLERVETCCLTDWSGGRYLADMPVPAQAHSLIAGSLEWAPNPQAVRSVLPSTSNSAGMAPATGMTSRTGLLEPEAAMRSSIDVIPGERVLVLGDGEHSYEALLIAEEIEEKGGSAAVQCITRTPALQGHAMRTVSRFDDAYGSGAPCYLYNILEHRPERIIIASEIAGKQAHQARAAVCNLGLDIPVEMIVCGYSGAGEGA